MVPSPADPHTRGPAAFVEVLRLPGSALFSFTGLLARLPISMIGLSIVLLVTSAGSSYALAGALSASFALSAALIGPYGARIIDRLGQHRVLPFLAAAQSLGLVLLVVGLDNGWPLPMLFAVAIAAGAVGPNLGSLVRARWIAQLRNDPRLRTAFAWEAVADEVVFIVGPPLATFLALDVGPSAGLLFSAALITAGSLALAAQRRTEPRAAPRQRGTRAKHALLLPGMPWLIGLMVLLGAVFGAFEVTTVAFAQSQDAAAATGWLLAAYAAGSLLGGVLLGSSKLPGSLTSQLRASTVLLGAVSVPLVFAPNVQVLAACAAAAGFGVAPVLILATALLEVLVAPARITEALTVTSSGLAVGLSVAAPAAGVLIDEVSARSGYLIVSGAALGTALLMMIAAKPLHRLESHG